MADIDIFSLEPSKISADLKGKYILLYGAEKTGKSTFGSKLPRSLFLQFENGTNALSGIKGINILRWSDAKKVLTQLRKPQAKEIYDTVVVDTADIAYNLCERYIIQREGVDNIRSIPWGQGFNMVKQEFSEFFREISLLQFGILFIAHEKTFATDLKDDEGNEIIGVRPDLASGPSRIINSLVDIIAYLKTTMKENGETERFLYTRATPTIFAGSRYKYLAPKIAFGDNGYNELVNAITEAIEKDVELNNAQVSTGETNFEISRVPFESVMAEAKDLWVSYIGRGETEEEKERNLNILNDIILKVFGKPVKLSTVLPSQQDLLELVVDEFKNL